MRARFSQHLTQQSYVYFRGWNYNGQHGTIEINKTKQKLHPKIRDKHDRQINIYIHT